LRLSVHLVCPLSSDIEALSDWTISREIEVASKSGRNP